VALILLAGSHLPVVTQASAPGVAGRPADVGPSRRPSPSATGQTLWERDWPNVRIDDPYTRDAARRAVQGASQWLARPKCQTLFLEFKDERHVPLSARLHEMEIDPEGYIRIVLFLDGAQSATCKRHGVLAFTAQGSRVVYLCGRDFERAWRRDAREVRAAIIHELLHSLGLGENPPSPREITHRVQELCWE
jgi:hypothetical protein